MRRQSVLISGWMVGLCAACACASEPEAAKANGSNTTHEAAAKGQTIDPIVAEADRLLSEAQDAIGAARTWMRQHITDAQIARTQEEAEKAVNGAWERALAHARAELERSLGLWVFNTARSDATSTTPIVWNRPGQSGPLPERVVLLIHGLDDAGSLWNDAAVALAGAGHTPVAFNYRNDQPIARSAEDLAAALRQLRQMGVKQVVIVGHSMGGLLARDVLTRPGLYGGDGSGGPELPAVTRLIMLGPPNNGAPLAPLRGVMEVRDQFARWLRSDGASGAAMLGFLVDGRGEAGDDLKPGSPFLAELNARPMPKGVTFTIVVGSLGDECRGRVAQALETDFARRVLGEQAASLRAAVDAAAQTLGDGCVPAGSAALAGVDDVISVEADHRSMIARIEALETARAWLGAKERPVPPAIPIILERLR